MEKFTWKWWASELDTNRYRNFVNGDEDVANLNKVATFSRKFLVTFSTIESCYLKLVRKYESQVCLP